MLSQRHRQWAIIGPALLERRIVFDGKLRDGLYMAIVWESVGANILALVLG